MKRREPVLSRKNVLQSQRLLQSNMANHYGNPYDSYIPLRDPNLEAFFAPSMSAVGYGRVHSSGAFNFLSASVFFRAPSRLAIVLAYIRDVNTNLWVHRCGKSATFAAESERRCKEGSLRILVGSIPCV